MKLDSGKPALFQMTARRVAVGNGAHQQEAFIAHDCAMKKRHPTLKELATPDVQGTSRAVGVDGCTGARVPMFPDWPRIRARVSDEDTTVAIKDSLWLDILTAP